MSLPNASSGGIRPQEVSRARFQQTAVTLIDAHAQTLKNHDARLSIVTAGLAELTDTVQHNAKALETAANELYTRIPAGLGFWARLSWLVTGK